MTDCLLVVLVHGSDNLLGDDSANVKEVAVARFDATVLRVRDRLPRGSNAGLVASITSELIEINETALHVLSRQNVDLGL
jgi:hypothetical protein